MIACVCWTIAFLTGICSSHGAVLIPSLQKNDSGLLIDEEMASWINSIFPTMKPLGCLIGGFSADKCGRCTTLKVSMAFFTLGWTLVASASSAAMLISARVILGTATGIAADAFLALIDETADAHYRGLGVAIASIAFSAGLEVPFGLSSMMEWRVFAAMQVIVPIADLIVLFFIPESPVWLMRHGKPEEATRVLEYLWTKKMETYAYQEYQIMQKRCMCDKQRRILCSRRILKPFIIAHVFNVIQIFCGTNLFIFYTVDMITRIRRGNEAVLEDITAASITGFIRIIILAVTIWLLVVVGRRFIAIASSFSTGVCAIILGFLLAVNSDGTVLSPRMEGWLCLLLIFGYVLCSTPGLFLLPFSMLGEIVPNRIRGKASGYIFAVNDFGLGGMLKVYPQLISAIGVSGMYLMFGISALFCGVFVFLFLPETKDRSLNEIEDYFRDNLIWQKRNKKTADTVVQLENSVPLNR